MIFNFYEMCIPISHMIPRILNHACEEFDYFHVTKWVFLKKLTISMWQFENDKNHFEMEGDPSIVSWANA